MPAAQSSASNVHPGAVHTFSRDPAVSKARPCTLPQGLHWRTCAIGFDTTLPPPHLFKAKWGDLVDQMRVFMGMCVATQGFGGILEVNNKIDGQIYSIVVTNPAKGLTEGTCLAGPHPLSEPLSLCIGHRAFRGSELDSRKTSLGEGGFHWRRKGDEIPSPRSYRQALHGPRSSRAPLGSGVSPPGIRGGETQS